MAMHVPQTQGVKSMLKDGTKHFSGVEEAISRNITACRDIATIVKTSFGPNGMNKMIINHLDKLFVTSDAATIINELEVEHPAAKLLVLASQQQEAEVGDGTNFVIIFAGKLMEKAQGLLHMGLAPAEIISGYELAAEKALELLPDLVCHTMENFRDEAAAAKALVPCLSSKLPGREEFMAKLVAKACVDVCPKADANKHFNVDNVRTVKIPGQGVLSSSVIRGMVFHRTSNSTVTTAKDAPVAVYQCALDWMQTETKGTVLIKNAEELKSFSKGEEEMLEQQIKDIADSGAKVLVTNGKIGEMAQHFMNRFGLLSVKLTSKHDLRRLCQATGATPLPRLTPPAPSELGKCSEVVVQEIGDTVVTVFRQNDDSAVSTIVVRGATANIMDDVERAIDDGVNVYKLLTLDQRMLPGAGATEIELARQLFPFANKHKGLEQYSIAAFAEALEAIPHALAENAGIKAQDVVSRLYAAHEKGEKNAGFDNQAEEPAVTDVAAAGILDNFKTKYWGLRFATNAAATILRVDQIIMAKKAGGPKPPKQNYSDDD